MMDAQVFRAAVTLEGRIVRLVPLTTEHAEPLTRAAWDPEVSRFLRSALPSRPSEMAELIAHRLDLAREGLLLPFVTTLVDSGRVVGTTNFMRPDIENETVEIGGTWIDSRYWRCPVNSEAKFLMLRYAFERAGVYRIYFQTDARNLRSRTAIARLGAKEEATFREDAYLGDGFYRTSVYFGILAPEWPSARSRLEAALRMEWTPPAGGDALSSPSPRNRPEPFRVEAPAANPECLRSPPTLSGRYVTLVPLTREHIVGLAVAGHDPEVWRFLRFKPATDVERMSEFVTYLLECRDRGEVQPFAIFFNAESRPAGIVRYLEIDRQDNSVEIGTWIDSRLWRTSVNTEVKFLALRHAFETERVHRITLRTDSRNVRSKAAIERLGAVKEGILREHNLRPGGYRRTSLCYSILDREWPQVREGLARKLERPWSGSVPVAGPAGA